jgi:hypothetical protein
MVFPLCLCVSVANIITDLLIDYDDPSIELSISL